MTILQAVISGIVQGITEFFPISSSGHLVILHTIFGLKGPMLAFDVFLHFGTLASIVVFFRKDILGMFKEERSLLKFIIIGSVPAFVIGLLFKDTVESFFAMPKLVGSFLIITGVFLFIASLGAIYWKMIRSSRPLGLMNSIMIGIAQGVSILPGISRSGATIGTALVAGVNEEMALKYSFLLALPAVLGANILKLKEICGNLICIDTIPFIAGGIAAMVTGFFAIKVLFLILKRNLLFVFGIYCVLMGASVIILSSR